MSLHCLHPSRTHDIYAHNNDNFTLFHFENNQPDSQQVQDQSESGDAEWTHDAVDESVSLLQVYALGSERLPHLL